MVGGWRCSRIIIPGEKGHRSGLVWLDGLVSGPRGPPGLSVPVCPRGGGVGHPGGGGAGGRVIRLYSEATSDASETIKRLGVWLVWPNRT